MHAPDDVDERSVVRLSRLVGRRARGDDGRAIGRLDDLIIDGHASPPRVRALVIRTSRASTSVIAVADLIGIDPPLVRSGAPIRGAAEGLELAEGEILLARDVLDTQVYDISGQRIARVGDIDLEVRTGSLEVLAVDTGFGAVCHRLGLHTLGRRLGDQVVAWPDLHLTSARGHLVQLSAPRAAIRRMTDEQVAGLLARVTTTHGAEILASLPPARAAATLASTASGDAPRLVGAMHAADADAVLDALPPAHASKVRDALRAHARRPRRRYLRHRGRRSPRDRTPMSTDQ